MSLFSANQQGKEKSMKRLFAILAMSAMGLAGTLASANEKYAGNFDFVVWSTNPESFCQPPTSSGIVKIGGDRIEVVSRDKVILEGKVDQEGWIALTTTGLGSSSGAAISFNGKFKSPDKAEGVWSQSACAGAWSLQRKG